MKMFFVLLFLMLLPASYAWDWDTHEFICEQIYQTNKQLNDLLDREQFLRGCIAPDKEFMDTRYHHCYVAKECKSIDVSKVKPNSLAYFTDIENCTEEEYFDCPAMKKFDEALENATRSNFSFYLGVATHYFTDARVPVHQTMGEEWFDCHEPFELEIGEKLKSSERFWNVSRICDIYFPCEKRGETNRKCNESYTVEIFYAYEDIVELTEMTDKALCERLNLSCGSNYSYLLERQSTGLLGKLIDAIMYVLRVLRLLK